MNPCHVVEVKPVGKATDLELPFTEQDEKQKLVHEYVIGLHRKTSAETLMRNLKKYQDASRTPHIDKELLIPLLTAIRRLKKDIEIMTGELI